MNNEDLRNHCQTLIDHESRCLSKEELNLCKAVLGLLDQLRVAEEALEHIQNAYGSPYDEDDVTTTAREARERIKALRAGHERGGG